MRMLVGALALAASFVHTAAQPGQVQTLYTSPVHQRIDAFAQDDGLVAWFTPGAAKTCNAVWVWELGSIKQQLPAQGSAYHNVTCSWQVPPSSPVSLAVASNNGSPALLWTLHESASRAVKFDYVLGATVGDPNERRFQQVAHASNGAGLWLGGVAGGAGTLVYSVAQVQYKDQVACLSTPNAPGACDFEVSGGGIYRVVGRKQPALVHGAPPAVEVAASGNDVAYVAASDANAAGQPLPSPDVPVEVRDVRTGALVASITPPGTPLAIAIAGNVLALLTRTPAEGSSISWYDVRTGDSSGSVVAPDQTAPALSVGDKAIVFRVGRSIRVADLSTGKMQTVAKAASTPIGLSVAGTRVAWAENAGGHGRIRALNLP
jgi:hypothetical protein